MDLIDPLQGIIILVAGYWIVEYQVFKLGKEKGQLDQIDQVVTVLPGLLLAEMLLTNLFTFQHW